jgi:aquaporin Z
MVLTKRLIAEAIGTFALVASVCGAALVSGNSAGLGVALAIGFVVMSMIYALGPVSGGHFNPAVTIGFAVANRFESRLIPGYLAAQLAGGILAALVFYLVLSTKTDFQALGFASNGFGEHSGGGFPLIAAAIMEIVQTALFVLVILRVTRTGSGAGIMAPVAIGLTLAAMHIMSIPIANTSLNPARSTATALFADSWALQQLWLFWVAPLAGAALAGAVDKYFGD